MSLRPTEIALEKAGTKGLYVAIDDPDTVGVLLIPCSFEHRRVVSRVDLENDYELHPARCPASPQEAGEGGLLEGLRGEIANHRNYVSSAESDAIHAGAQGNQDGEKEARLVVVIHKNTAESLEALLPKGTK
jgi:hypothetical protein